MSHCRATFPPTDVSKQCPDLTLLQRALVWCSKLRKLVDRIRVKDPGRGRLAGQVHALGPCLQLCELAADNGTHLLGRECSVERSVQCP